MAMKKTLMISLIFTIGLVGGTWAESAVDDITIRYNKSLDNAKAYCTGLTGKIDQVKLMAGIGIGAGGVGTIAGGAAVITGIMKSKTDDEIAKIEEEMENSKLTEEQIAAMSAQEHLKRLQEIDDYLKAKSEQIAEKKNKSQTLGNIRTAGAFVAGAGGVAGAATSFTGANLLDTLIKDIDACNSSVAEIEKQTTELRLESPDDPAIAQMNKITEACKGLNSKNIAEVKKAMFASGVVSAVGAAAGITGGITSAIAVSKEKNGASATADGGTKGLNMAANISSGVAAVGNLGGAILSGVVLGGLITNGETAAKCKEVF